MKIRWRLIKAIIILPGTVLVFIPLIILYVANIAGFSFKIANPTQIIFYLGVLAVFKGIILSIWTSALFVKFGHGTPAPWDPPKKLVVLGPYRYVRNPMISGVTLILFAEAVLLQSWPIAVWMLIFFLGNIIYLRYFEEKGLEKRFGDDYKTYKSNVPMWIPRLTPWLKS
ncbi:MAG: isoprenylcysteine carboxylmethyltransferase family protein [bacterium]